MRKIALYGIGGLYNYGCEAIIRGTTKLIRGAFPDAQISYYTPDVTDLDRIADLDINVSLIYAGEINKNKNLQLTIKAINILKEQGIKTSFYVIGEVTEPSCKKLLEAHYIQYYQKCSQEQLIEHYRSCDIFVMPSHTENFGLVYAEAMSQGLPIIYTRGQGFDGHFSEGIVGYSVSDKNPAELAEKIKLILNNYEEISSNCIIKAKEFDWDKIADVYLKMYKNIKQ